MKYSSSLAKQQHTLIKGQDNDCELMNVFLGPVKICSLLSIKQNNLMEPTESHLDIILAINHLERTLSHGWQCH